MKKIFCIFLVAAFSITMASCSKKDGVKTEAAADETKAVTVSENGDIIDLTQLSTTVVYSELYNMVTDSSSYIGKKIKMRGKFAVYEGDGRNYYVCEVTDSTACCSQGLEFVLKGNPDYTDGYPHPGQEIELYGTLKEYVENGESYVQLEDAEVTVINT